jgi:hypothetical protein
MRRQPVRTSLTRLEDALGGSLVEKLQEAVQHEGTLDSVATQHLVQGLTWVGSLRDIDAAPPVYQGLERAFKLVARQRGIVDQKNILLIPDPHQRKATKIEDLFRYLDLDPRYERFLNAWVFGEMSALVRHGDLAEDEHRTASGSPRRTHPRIRGRLTLRTLRASARSSSVHGPVSTRPSP